MVKPNWEILMSPKSLKMVFSTLKQVHRTMQVHKFGKMNHMMLNLTYGRWDV